MKGSVRGYNPTEQTVSLEASTFYQHMREFQGDDDGSLPHADELDLDVDRERAFERVGLLPAEGCRVGVHPVRKRDLLVIPCGEETDLVCQTLEKVQIWREEEFFLTL